MGSVFLHIFWLKQETEIKQSDFIEVKNNSPTTSKGGNKAMLKPKTHWSRLDSGPELYQAYAEEGI